VTAGGRSGRLIEQVRVLLGDALDAYRDTPYEVWLAGMVERLEEPLRVAIAGRVKAGKSTLVNALVGERVAATDAGECTRVVTWYADGVAPRAWAHPHDGPPTQLRFTRADGGTTIDLGPYRPEDLERLHVEFPSSRLRALTLIDTPGIASLSADASARTQDLLAQQRGGPLGAGGGYRQADAVVYLMRHLHTADVNFLEAFHDGGVSRATVGSAIGVLSRADEIGAGSADSLDRAREIAAAYRREPRVRMLVQTVVPVAGLLAQAGATLREREFADLAALARAPEATTLLLLSADRFTAADAGVAVDAAGRRALLERLGLFGVRSSVELIRRGVVADAVGLARELVERSGLHELRAVLRNQFDARGEALRAERMLAGVEAILAAHPVAEASRLRALVERVRAGAREFDELWLLNELRAGTLAVPAERAAAMERLLGGEGGTPTERLGLPAGTVVAEVEEALLAELARWQQIAESPVADQRTRRAAMVLRRTCEAMFLDAATST
jgi:hypothetical protein